MHLELAPGDPFHKQGTWGWPEWAPGITSKLFEQTGGRSGRPGKLIKPTHSERFSYKQHSMKLNVTTINAYSEVTAGTNRITGLSIHEQTLSLRNLRDESSMNRFWDSIVFINIWIPTLLRQLLCYMIRGKLLSSYVNTHTQFRIRLCSSWGCIAKDCPKLFDIATVSVVWAVHCD